MNKALPFKRVVVCHTGDFKDDNENIKRWVELNKGTFSKELTSDVTHLIASKKAWKRYSPIVKAARRMRTVRIVNIDWLKYSLWNKPIKALPAEKYQYEQTRFKTKKIKKEPRNLSGQDARGATGKISIPRDKRIETTGLEFNRACQEFQEDMGSAGFHPYSDRTNFVYIITLLRYDIFKARFEKYRLKVDTPILSQVLPYRVLRCLKSRSHTHLAEPWAHCVQLYESDERPHTYACYTQYTRPGVQKQVHVLAPPGSTWNFAWSMFEKFFAKRIGQNWDNRAAVGTEINLDGDTEAKDDGEDGGISGGKDHFQYLAPKLGEPDGVRGGQWEARQVTEGDEYHEVGDEEVEDADGDYDDNDDDSESTGKHSDNEIEHEPHNDGQDAMSVEEFDDSHFP